MRFEGCPFAPSIRGAARRECRFCAPESSHSPTPWTLSDPATIRTARATSAFFVKPLVIASPSPLILQFQDIEEVGFENLPSARHAVQPRRPCREVVPDGAVVAIIERQLAGSSRTVQRHGGAPDGERERGRVLAGIIGTQCRLPEHELSAGTLSCVQCRQNPGRCSAGA